MITRCVLKARPRQTAMAVACQESRVGRREDGCYVPQLKRVIVVYGKKVVMEPTIGEAIEAVFGVVRRAGGEVPAPPEAGAIAERARRELERAQNALGRGNWVEFGRAMERLKELLARPQERGKGK